MTGEQATQATGFWADYLSENEIITSQQSLGFYEVATTNERVLFLRKFPKSYTETRYEDIHSLSHKTRPNWARLVKALAWIGVAYYLYTISPLSGSMVLVDFVFDIIKKYVTELQVLPIDKLASLLPVAVAAYGLLNLAKFAPTLQGVFIITLKSKSPIKVPTSLTPQLRKLMKQIESGMSQAGKPQQPQVIAVQAAAGAAGAPQEEKGQEEVSEKIASGIKETKDKGIILIKSQSVDQAKSVVAALTALVKEAGKTGVYISMSRPYSQVTKDLTAAGIPAEKLLFIDAISYMTGETPEKKEGVYFIENPSSLEEVGMYLDMHIQKASPQFVFFDSLDSLMIYNDEKTTREFAHYLINKLRLDGLGGIILSVEKKEVENIVKTLVPMCDKQISV